MERAFCFFSSLFLERVRLFGIVIGEFNRRIYKVHRKTYDNGARARANYCILVRFVVRRCLDNRLIILPKIITNGQGIINGASALRSKRKTHAAYSRYLRNLPTSPSHFSLPSPRLHRIYSFSSPESWILFFPLTRLLSGILFGVCPSLLLAEIIEVFSTSEQWASSLEPHFFAHDPWTDRIFCGNESRNVPE